MPPIVAIEYDSSKDFLFVMYFRRNTYFADAVSVVL